MRNRSKKKKNLRKRGIRDKNIGGKRSKKRRWAIKASIKFKGLRKLLLRFPW